MNDCRSRDSIRMWLHTMDPRSGAGRPRAIAGALAFVVIGILVGSAVVARHMRARDWCAHAVPDFPGYPCAADQAFCANGARCLALPYLPPESQKPVTLHVCPIPCASAEPLCPAFYHCGTFDFGGLRDIRPPYGPPWNAWNTVPLGSDGRLCLHDTSVCFSD